MLPGGLLGVTGGEGLWTADERLAGFIETMNGAGVPVDPALCVRTDYRGESAYAATVPLLTRTDRPSAIIGANNVIALGALQATVDLGFRCPADVSIAGIDDVPWAGLVRPRITTVAQPIAEISRVAIEWLVERMTDPTSPGRRATASSSRALSRASRAATFAIALNDVARR